MNDLVSIIMPSYNTTDYIMDAIDSVLNQTYDNWELIIVDDCSNDDSYSQLSAISDERIHVYYNEKNMGAAYCRNRALELANGKWVAFLDSDDRWLDTKLEKQIEFMVAKGINFSYTDYVEIDSSGNRNGVYVTGPLEIDRDLMFKFCWPGCLTVMYNRKKVGDLRISDIKKNNDYAMWLILCEHYKCYLLPECLAEYRRGRNGSISTEGYLELIKWHYKLFREAQKENVFSSVKHTILNLIYGIYKKLKYVKRC